MLFESKRYPRLSKIWLLGLALWLASVQGLPAASPTSDEIAETRYWVAAKFEGIQTPEATEPGLVVLANHGPVQKNARGKGPLRIGDTQFDRGFYCHAFPVSVHSFD